MAAEGAEGAEVAEVAEGEINNSMFHVLLNEEASKRSQNLFKVEVDD